MIRKIILLLSIFHMTATTATNDRLLNLPRILHAQYTAQTGNNYPLELLPEKLSKKKQERLYILLWNKTPSEDAEEKIVQEITDTYDKTLKKLLEEKNYDVTYKETLEKLSQTFKVKKPWWWKLLCVKIKKK